MNVSFFTDQDELRKCLEQHYDKVLILYDRLQQAMEARVGNTQVNNPENRPEMVIKWSAEVYTSELY